MSNEKFIFCFKITIKWNHYLIGLAFLFIIRIRFPRGKSIADIIRNRYGEAFVKKIQRFEKCDFKLWKCHLDLRFLLDCKKNGVIPKFLRFKLAKRHLNKFSYEVSAVSSSLALITDISLLHKSSCFMSQNNNSKGNKNSEYSINPGLTEKLRPLHKTFFSSSVNLYEEKLKITLSGL